MFEIIEALVPPTVVAIVVILGVRAVLKKERADRAQEAAGRKAAQKAARPPSDPGGDGAGAG
ncbi:hypothetical protein [Thermoactinospora rubra]|uniref:hypothetical protein n=1 Tax=Thermoactinospora rubra TaxID=1088767 RepID=UPI000A0F8AE8|nr:hypothetical protein [Thermoactinospora rubra]